MNSDLLVAAGWFSDRLLGPLEAESGDGVSRDVKWQALGIVQM